MRREHRPDQRSRPGDGCEVVTEHHPFIRRNKVASVFHAFGGRGAQGVKGQDFGCDKFAVKTIAHGISADRRDHQPHGVDLLAAMQGNGCQSQRAQKGDRQPDQNA